MVADSAWHKSGRELTSPFPWKGNYGVPLTGDVFEQRQRNGRAGADELLKSGLFGSDAPPSDAIAYFSCAELIAAGSFSICVELALELLIKLTGFEFSL